MALQQQLGHCDLDIKSTPPKPTQFIRPCPSVCLWSMVEFGLIVLLQFLLTMSCGWMGGQMDGQTDGWMDRQHKTNMSSHSWRHNDWPYLLQTLDKATD